MIYKIATGNNAPELVVEVSDMIANGYTPQGGVSAIPETLDSYQTFCQAMIKKDKDDE